MYFSIVILIIIIKTIICEWEIIFVLILTSSFYFLIFVLFFPDLIEPRMLILMLLVLLKEMTLLSVELTLLILELLRLLSIFQKLRRSFVANVCEGNLGREVSRTGSWLRIKLKLLSRILRKSTLSVATIIPVMAIWKRIAWHICISLSYLVLIHTTWWWIY